MAGVLKTGVTLTIAIAVAGCATTARQAVDPSALGVAEAAKAIRDKQVTSTQLTQAALDRAEANAALNAFVTAEGMRLDPPVSLPRPPGAMPAAMAAAVPLELPPAKRLRS